MTRNNNSRRKVTIFPKTKAIEFLSTDNGDTESERRSLRFDELDDEYDRQLRHLKKIGMRARSRFLKFNQRPRIEDNKSA
jgi:hypothetical protein